MKQGICRCELQCQGTGGRYAQITHRKIKKIAADDAGYLFGHRVVTVNSFMYIGIERRTISFASCGMMESASSLEGTESVRSISCGIVFPY